LIAIPALLVSSADAYSGLPAGWYGCVRFYVY